MAKHATCLVQSLNFIYSDTKPAINHQRIRPSRTHVILNHNSYVLRILALECIAKWCLISQYVTTTLSKAAKQDDRSLV